MAFPARRPLLVIGRIRTIRWAATAAPAGSCAVLVAGFVGLVEPLIVIAVAVGLTAVVGAWRLIRLALTIHASHRTFGPCRGAGFLGMGVLVGGLMAAALPAVASAPGGGQGVAAAGVVAATTMYLLGMLLLPGAATTPRARLRRGIDGLSVGTSLSFIGWVLLPAALMPSAGLVAGLVAVGGLSIVTVTAVRAARYRRAALLCGAGAAAGLVGLAAITMQLAYAGSVAALLAAAIPLVAAPELAWAGARRAGSGPEPAQAADASGVPATYPLLAVPIGLSVLAAVYHLLTVGQFDRVAVSIGLATGALLATREAMTTGDMRRYARRLARQEAHFRSLVAGAGDLIVVLDDDLVVRWQSAAAARLFGLSDSDVVGHPFVCVLHPDDVGRACQMFAAVLAGHVQSAGGPGGAGRGGAGAGRRGRQLPGQVRPALLPARLRDGFGRWRDTESTITDLRDVPDVAALVLHVRDVSERLDLERMVQQAAYTDQLTGLPNRRELMRTIVSQRGAGGNPGALLAIDLHGLATANDARGREVGDAVLVEVGRRLRVAVGPDDTPGRLGGDEFGVVTPAGPVLAYALGTRLLAELSRPYALPGEVVHLEVSVGLTEISENVGVDDLLSRADQARRRARQLGRNRVDWYDAFLEEQLTRRMDLERELAGAIARRELDVAFQPVVNLLDRRPVGMEALLRWRHRTLGTVPPAEVVPIAEELGIIGDIGSWMLDAACRHLSQWLATGNDIWMSVNVSPRQLIAPDFLARVQAALATYRLPPHRLVIEIAESRLTPDLGAVITRIAALQALGVRTALDDFGASHASLAHLRRLPVDILKIDGSLVAEPADRRDSASPVIDVVVSLGRRLGLELIAEGLENRSALDEALNAGCRLGQGFLLGRPGPAEHIEAYLEDHRSPML